MRTKYLRHLANIVDMHSVEYRPVWGGGGGGNSQLNWLTCCKQQKKCKFAVADKHDAVPEVIDGQAIL